MRGHRRGSFCGGDVPHVLGYVRVRLDRHGFSCCESEGIT